MTSIRNQYEAHRNQYGAILNAEKAIATMRLKMKKPNLGIRVALFLQVGAPTIIHMNQRVWHFPERRRVLGRPNFPVDGGYTIQ